MKKKLQQTSLHAAFFMEGLHDVGYMACIEAWAQGCIEMIAILVSYAPFMQELIEKLEKNNPDLGYPGVLDYEVSSCFGKWFGEHIIATGDVPSKNDAEKWLSDEVIRFFSQELSLDATQKLGQVLHAGLLVNNTQDAQPKECILADLQKVGGTVLDEGGVTEGAARHEDFCRGCGSHKESETGLPVVCWSCWKGEALSFTPYKYFTGTFAEWLAEVKTKTGKVFNELCA